jgi:signal transduction histidine kinase
MRRVLDWLHACSLRTQVVLMLGFVAFVSAALTTTFVAMSVPVAMQGAPVALVHQTSEVVAIVAALGAFVTVLAALGAAALLRSSIGDTIREMQRATAAIAGGGFDHRVNSARTDELGALAGSIDAMAARLAELERSRQRFLASVSHELRTPLTVIRGQAFTMARGETDARRLERLELIDGEVERLAGLIDDLLTASTLRAATVRLDASAGEVGELVAAAGERFLAEAADRGLVLEIDVERTGGAGVRVDSSRVHQVIGNLLANALRHAPRGSRVLLGARVRGGGRTPSVRIAIGNAGPCIPREQQEWIFEPFAQGEHPTGRVGLGLSIARDLVRAHGSELSVSSQGGWTTFYFELPVAVARDAAPAGARLTARYAT